MFEICIKLESDCSVRTLTTVLVYVCMSQVVYVTFNELGLEQHTTCRYDSVSLYDGSSSNSSSLGEFCTTNWSSIISSGSSLLVVFQTDLSHNEGRFSLNWMFLNSGCESWYTLNISRSIAVEIETTNYQPSYRNSFLWMTSLTGHLRFTCNDP